jgi:hypothetical protein
MEQIATPVATEFPDCSQVVFSVRCIVLYDHELQK